jgi:hypothetical protein
MNTTLKHRGRKAGSKFDRVCSFINALDINFKFASKEARDYTGVDSERLCYILKFLREAKVLVRVGRGEYKVLSHIPEFVTYNMLEANRGYKRYDYINGKYSESERGLPWKAGEPNPHLAQKLIKSTDELEKFIDVAVSASLPTITEIEEKLPEPNKPSQSFENKETVLDIKNQTNNQLKEPAMRILHNSIYGAYPGAYAETQSLNNKENPITVDFKFIPGTLVYYIEFNKICSSYIHRIALDWEKNSRTITYFTSHGEYTDDRIFASKEDLVVSLLMD